MINIEINTEIYSYSLFLVQKDYSNYANIYPGFYNLEGTEYKIYKGQYSLAPSCLAWWEEE